MEWQKNYGTTNNEFGNSVIETADHGFLIAGSSYNGNDFDFYIIRTDQSGNKIWSKTFGSETNDAGTDIIRTTDGNYLITGSLFSTCLIKIDPAGNEIWSKTYDSYESAGSRLIRLSNGNIVIAGWAGSSNMKLICTDGDGNQLWNKILNPGAGGALIEKDGGILSTGYGLSIESDTYIFMTDYSGNKLWSRIVGGNGHDSSGDIAATYDGGFVIFGSSSSFGNGEEDFWLVKFNKDGNTLIGD